MDGVVRTWSAAAERLFGFAAAEIVGRSALRVTPRVAPEPTIEIETEARRADGSSLRVGLTIAAPSHGLLACRVWEHAGGRDRAVLNADLAVREFATDAVITSDRAGQVIELNPSAERMLGWTRAAARGRSLGEVLGDGDLHALDPDALLDAMLDPVGAALDAPMVAVSVRDSDEQQIRVRAARGLPADVIGWPIQLGEGVSGRIAARGPRAYHAPQAVVEPKWRQYVPQEIIGVPPTLGEETIGALVVGRELPFDDDHAALLERFAERIARAIDHGRTHAAARAAESRLRGLIVDVTESRELESRFLQAQKMQAVGQLAGGVAHDFNNMLTAIIGYSGLLAARLTDPESRDDLAEIDRAAKRAQALTEQLLAFSRRQAPRRELLDLGELVAGLEPMLRRLIDEDIELVVEPGAHTVLLEGDTGRLEQVLINLVINARDAMATGGRLTVAVGTSGGDALLTVRDNGSGMDDATRTRIFEPFFTTKEPGKGTGLGLATVYSIVDAAGGRIEVESAPGEGTEITVAVPLVSPEPEPEPDPGRATVLIVEDEAALRKLVRRVLEADGRRVLDAADGRAALEVLEREGEDVDLLITDVVMPGMNGPELVEVVSTRWPELKVIYSSGYTDSRLAGRGFDERKVDLLRKPYSVDELRRRVDQALG